MVNVDFLGALRNDYISRRYNKKFKRTTMWSKIMIHLIFSPFLNAKIYVHNVWKTQPHEMRFREPE
uniref:PiggyBac transposable element-derived protein domain-containing protein n=1 Tax=Romanomermis culicivorax TaxID=13658 RepID=A0A915IFR3_ROMCU